MIPAERPSHWSPPSCPPPEECRWSPAPSRSPPPEPENWEPKHRTPSPHIVCNLNVIKSVWNVINKCCGGALLQHLSGEAVPFRAFRRRVDERFLRFGVWDGNDVFVEGSHDLRSVHLVSELPGVGVPVVGVWEVGESDLGRGAERRVDDRKRRGESRFGACHCWVVALQEVFIDLAVFLLETHIVRFKNDVN